MKLRVDAVSVMLGARSVLEDVAFEARGGEMIAVLGANGAGKSTLLRTIAGLMPFEGAITFEGRDIRTMATTERARVLAFLPQAPVVHWPLTGRDVVAIGRLPHGSSLTALRAEDQTAILKALRRADAEQFAERPVTELSGGERARVLLARALAVESPLLLADEPLSALDASHQLTTLATLRETAEAGCLVIAALHDLSLAARFATRVLLLSGMRLAADGLPSTVLTPERLAQAFSIEAAFVEHEGINVPLPWRAKRAP